jgi:hemolysin activation/secretion protein
MTAAVAMALVGASPSLARGDEAPAPAAASVRTFEIAEYRVEGATRLSTAEVESVLYPFLGPGRVLEDVERARAALEKAYSDRGFQSVTVTIPPQTVRQGVVTLKVTEGKVGRLRVRGSRWFSLSEIKREAPSVAEGTVPNFNDIVRDIVVLNQSPDRRVTPVLRAGAVPGTIDVDLNVQDRFPLHGSLELNNRYSPNTTKLRINGSIRYDNLWQSGHSLSFSFQIAPQRIMDGKVFSASYLARIPDVPWLSLSANGVLQDSDVSTLGTIDARGRGRIFGVRALFTLPGTTALFQTVNTGLDYKRFEEGITLGGDTLSTPVTYWPWTTQYGATWAGETSQTQLNATVTFNLRGLSSGTDQFDSKRYKASGSFIYYRADLSRTEELPLGMQLFGRLQGQYSTDPLIGSEQFTAGGAESVRGYLEVQAVGDFGALGTAELRGPNFAKWIGTIVDEWRLHAFAEGGRLGLYDSLPDQESYALLWSVGGGSRFRLLEHLNGSVDVGVPLTSVGSTRRHHPRVQFRVWSEF